ncbi:MAG: sigma-70 family RNA polymerase sigma factor [Planctomycetaceae bacterium]|nr:sigma-70 family RNA polymerase sigma factor [Planctomycetaceae bacterium]
MTNLSPPKHHRCEPIRFVSHPLFSRPDAREQIENLRPESITAIPFCDEEESPNCRRSPIGQRCEERVLTRKEERYLFLRMNFEKFSANESQGERRAMYLAEARILRNRIVVSNFRLLVSIASQFALPPLRTEELISEGVIPLMRAVDLFDVSRGWAFGTYATHVLRNHFRRMGKRLSRKSRLEASFDDSQMVELPDEGVSEDRQQELTRQSQFLVQQCLAELPAVDQRILRTRFGFDDPASSKVRSYAEVGKVVGLSKERVRVRTHQALEHLRETAQSHHWEFPEVDLLQLHA